MKNKKIFGRPDEEQKAWGVEEDETEETRSR